MIKSRRMRWVTNVTNMRDNGYVEIVVGKREGKRPRGRLRHRWEDIIKMDLTEIGWGWGHWIHLAADVNMWQAVLNTVINFRVP